MPGKTSKPVVTSRFVSGTRAEQIRIKADTRDGRPVVRLDLLEPVASHTSSMTVIGRAMMIPAAQVDTLIEALYAAKVETGEPEPAVKEEF